MSDVASPALWWGLLGLVGLIGLAGLMGLRHPIDRSRPGAGIRLLGILGLLGIAGLWIPGAGAAGAFGALGLWNHPRADLHRWAKLGWLGLSGLLPIVLAMASAVAGAATAPPTEGLSAQGKEVVTTAADRIVVTLIVTGTGRSPEDARSALETTARDALARIAAARPDSGAAPETTTVADLPATQSTGSGDWVATREIRVTLASEPAQRLLPSLAARAGVAVGGIEPTHSDLAGLRRLAIERATAAAQARGEAAARSLGFALGAVRDVAVKTEERRSTAMIDVEAQVDIRYALAPATTRTEVLAIAAAQQTPRNAATREAALREAAPRVDTAARPLEVEIVGAVYDTTGRGRFTTATGTVWREVVPAPASQRLKPGRRYRGTITLGLISGYRMAVEGVARILKVEPLAAERP